ncbi:hypothetical protein V1478_017033 [Vespula squamosa]|uniref:Uncharacterized protein n=2 Tax=Vespula TaxID=7451 RepID=A0A834N630_VESPE|nr:hypothetical protein H0235_016168 [Vespula pensylvanica]
MLMEKPMGPYVAPSTQDPRNNTAPHETNRRISSVPINHLAHGPAIRLLEEGVIILPDCCDARPPWVQYWTLSPLEYLRASRARKFT